MQGCFTLYFKFRESTSVKSYKMQLPLLLFLVIHFLFLYHQIAIFTSLSELSNIFIRFSQHYLKRLSQIVPNFPFLIDSFKTPTP